MALRTLLNLSRYILSSWLTKQNKITKNKTGRPHSHFPYTSHHSQYLPCTLLGSGPPRKTNVWCVSSFELVLPSCPVPTGSRVWILSFGPTIPAPQRAAPESWPRPWLPWCCHFSVSGKQRYNNTTLRYIPLAGLPPKLLRWLLEKNGPLGSPQDYKTSSLEPRSGQEEGNDFSASRPFRIRWGRRKLLPLASRATSLLLELYRWQQELRTWDFFSWPLTSETKLVPLGDPDGWQSGN